MMLRHTIKGSLCRCRKSASFWSEFDANDMSKDVPQRTGEKYSCLILVACKRSGGNNVEQRRLRYSSKQRRKPQSEGHNDESGKQVAVAFGNFCYMIGDESRTGREFHATLYFRSCCISCLITARGK